MSHGSSFVDGKEIKGISEHIDTKGEIYVLLIERKSKAFRNILIQKVRSMSHGSSFVDGKEIKGIPEHIDTKGEIYEPWL